jgi:hypothetical protein
LIATSADAITWTARTADATWNAVPTRIGYGGGIYVALGKVGGTPVNWLQTSSDGIAWTVRVSTGNYGFDEVGFGEGDAVDSYANGTDLLDNTKAPKPGFFKPYLGGGYFRLGATPAGLVTADVTEGATAADRTVAQLYKRNLVRLGKSAADYSGADITAVDSAISSVIGLWADLETQYGLAFDDIVESGGASWYVDKLGIFRIAQLTAPIGPPVLVITANDFLKPLEAVTANDDPGIEGAERRTRTQGIPTYKTIVRYARNYTPQDSDLAAAVSDARRIFLAQEWREAQATDAAVQTVHLLAPQSVEESLLSLEANAQSEATRRQALRGVRRDMFLAKIPWTDETAPLDLVQIVELQHPRYRLGEHSLFRILGIKPDAKDRSLELTCWGTGRASIYYNTFNRRPVDEGWTIVNSATESLVASGSTFGVTVLSLAGSVFWKITTTPYIPYNPAKLYRATMRIRCTVDAAVGNRLIYWGSQNFLAGGATANNNVGYAYYGQHSGVSLAVADGWQTFIGYFKGATLPYASGSPGPNDNDPTNPVALNVDTAFLRPFFSVNYPAGAGTYEIDYMHYEEV